MRDHEVEMESKAERRRLTRVGVQRHCRAENNSQRQHQQEADQCRNNLISAYISQALVVAASDCVTALIS